LQGIERLQQQGGFADAGIAANQDDAAFHHAAAQSAVEFFDAGGAAVDVCGFDVAQLGELGRFGQGLKLAGVPVFGVAASVNGTFKQGVPSAACWAFAQPTRGGATAIGAGENGFVFGHGASLTLRREQTRNELHQDQACKSLWAISAAGKASQSDAF